MTNHARLNSLITRAKAGNTTEFEDKEMNALHKDKMKALNQGLDWEIKHLKK